MRNFRRITVVYSENITTYFVEGEKLLFETTKYSYKDIHNEAMAFEMGLSIGLGVENFSLEPFTMTPEEFKKLTLVESPWCGLGPRTKNKK